MWGCRECDWDLCEQFCMANDREPLLSGPPSGRQIGTSPPLPSGTSHPLSSPRTCAEPLLQKAPVTDCPNLIDLEPPEKESLDLIDVESFCIDTVAESLIELFEVQPNSQEASTLPSDVTEQDVWLALADRKGSCTGDHVLATFLTDRDGYSCNVCLTLFPKDSVMLGCRICNFDVCLGACMREKESLITV